MRWDQNCTLKCISPWWWPNQDFIKDLNLNFTQSSNTSPLTVSLSLYLNRSKSSSIWIRSQVSSDLSLNLRDCHQKQNTEPKPSQHSPSTCSCLLPSWWAKRKTMEKRERERWKRKREKRWIKSSLSHYIQYVASIPHIAKARGSSTQTQPNSTLSISSLLSSLTLGSIVLSPHNLRWQNPTEPHIILHTLFDLRSRSLSHIVVQYSLANRLKAIQ